MAQCPGCQGSIPTWRLWILTNFSTVTCASCGSVLRANRLRHSSIGGIFGVAWALIWIWGSRSGWSFPVLLTALLCLVGMLYAIAVFTRLEIVKGADPDKTA